MEFLHKCMKCQRKFFRFFGILKKLQLIVPNNILLTIYITLILPHITYWLLSWGNKPDNIFQIQKRAIWAISGANSKSHTEPLFKLYNILKVNEIQIVNTLLERKTSTTT